MIIITIILKKRNHNHNNDNNNNLRIPFFVPKRSIFLGNYYLFFTLVTENIKDKRWGFLYSYVLLTECVSNFWNSSINSHQQVAFCFATRFTSQMLTGNFAKGFTRTHYFDQPFLANQVHVHVNNFHNGISMTIQVHGCEQFIKPGGV